jgi:hypothetical protein
VAMAIEKTQPEKLRGTISPSFCIYIRATKSCLESSSVLVVEKRGLALLKGWEKSLLT